jgi:hypothetical protein
LIDVTPFSVSGTANPIPLFNAAVFVIVSGP